MPRYFAWYVGAGGYRRPVKGFDNQTIWINPDTSLIEVKDGGITLQKLSNSTVDHFEPYIMFDSGTYRIARYVYNGNWEATFKNYTIYGDYIEQGKIICYALVNSHPEGSTCALDVDYIDLKIYVDGSLLYTRRFYPPLSADYRPVHFRTNVSPNSDHTISFAIKVGPYVDGTCYGDIYAYVRDFLAIIF